jgi:hypothetical protein
VRERRRRRARLLIARAAANEIARALANDHVTQLTDDVLAGHASALSAAIALLQRRQEQK